MDEKMNQLNGQGGAFIYSSYEQLTTIICRCYAITVTTLKAFINNALTPQEHKKMFFSHNLYYITPSLLLGDRRRVTNRKLLKLNAVRC
jgi:hypothetical protein